MSDAARECGVRLYAPRPDNVPLARMRQILERALVMMRGNQSATLITYFTRDDQLRLAQIYEADASRPEELAREDDRLAEVLLDQAFGIQRGAKKRAIYRPGHPRTRASSRANAPAIITGVHRPTALTADEIEHFITRGYVILRDCFTREAAASWVSAANRRISDDPLRWIRGYASSDASRDLTRFDARDPATWTWPRMDVDGDHRVPIEEFAPKAWRAMCDLLGGEARIKTKQWSNYFAVNCCDQHEVPWKPPPPDAPSWHFDDPSTRTRFSTYTHGLISLAYFSDVAPRAGGTFLAPASVGHVARKIAASPEGVDLRDRASGPAIVTRCEETLELTGEVGTVTLCHPLMAHSCSANPSGKVRYLGNTVIDLREPINLERRDPAAHSPIERSILRALQ
jgi:hypothetical protein